MTVFALNGLGRIGKLALRPLFERGAEIAWINDAVGDTAMHAHLLEFDTVHGRWDAAIAHDRDGVTIDGTRLPFVGTKDLSAPPRDGVDVIIDCTGAVKSDAKLAPYFEAGVKKVVVSAPVFEVERATTVEDVNALFRAAAEGPLNRAAIFTIGAFMAVWIILYGAVQAAAPRLLRAAHRPDAQLIVEARGWAAHLFAVLAVLTAAALVSPEPAPWPTVTLVAGLLIFGAIFAVNSALHSYLILAFTRAERVTLDAGFYYMANAGGRLLGTVLSGFTYQIGGLALMFGTAAAMVAGSALAAGRLRPDGSATRTA